MPLLNEFDEMLRSRNIRYLSDTVNMLCALSDRLTEGLHFDDIKKQLDLIISGQATNDQREEFISEIQASFSREAERFQHRLQVLKYLCQEMQERLENPDMQSIGLAPHELPQPEERPSLPHPADPAWSTRDNLAAKIDANDEQRI